MSQKEPGLEQDVLTALKETWEKYPELRLSQLIINAISPTKPEHMFYLEDSKLLALLNDFKNPH